MSSDEREALRLQDVVDNIDRIEGYLAGCDIETYAHDEKTIDAVERCLQRLTEAVIRIGPERMAENLAADASGRGARPGKPAAARIRHAGFAHDLANGAGELAGAARGLPAGAGVNAWVGMRGYCTCHRNPCRKMEICGTRA